MDSKLFVGVISVFVAIVVLAGALMPVINDAAGTEVIVHITNDDASTLTLQKATSNFALDLSVSTDLDNNIVIANGDDTMTIDPNESFFILASESAAIYYDQGVMVCNWVSSDKILARELTNPFTAEIADNKLTVDDGTVTEFPLPASYMFFPSSSGQYGSFTALDLNMVPDDPVIAAGSFAGVYCYNAYTRIGDYLQEYVTLEDDVLKGVTWAKPAPVDDQQIIITPLDPSIFDPLIPIDTDPIVIDPIDLDENQIMNTPPVPTYTEGDWGYDLITSGDYAGTAMIVAYSGTDTNITIPATIGGYDVSIVGKGSSNTPLIDTDFSVDTLTFSEGILKVNDYAFRLCKIDKIVLSSTVLTLGQYAFRQCTLTSINLQEGTTILPNFVFWGCPNLKWVEIPSTITQIQGSAFYNSRLDPAVLPEGTYNVASQAYSSSYITKFVVIGTPSLDGGALYMTNLAELLNLGNLTFTNGVDYIPDSTEIRQGDDAYIDAQLFLAPADVEIKEGRPGALGAFTPLLDAIPLLVIMAILMMIVGYTMIRRSY